MFRKLSTEAKVGFFALMCLVIIAVVTLKVSDRSIIAGGSYLMNVTMDTAIGIKDKTPVEIAGIQVGVVKKIKLDENHKAHVTLMISDEVRLSEGTVAFVRAKGFLGETFIELRPGAIENAAIPEDTALTYGGVAGDMNLLMTQFSDIASDIKVITAALKVMIGGDNSSPVFRTVQNLDQFTEALKTITLRNEDNLNRVINNLAILTDNLQKITGRVEEGKGTIGKLVNDDETVVKINEAVDSLNDALGSMKRMETEVGYHAEYLGSTNDFKNYVHLNLRPRPDEGFLFEFVSDANPPPKIATNTTIINAGGAQSTVTTTTQTVNREKFLFSAQLAKKFYNLTLRGGIIESTGGLGADYSYGPVGAHFSAWNFDTKYGQMPHLKAYADVNVTKSLYLMGGADDFISKQKERSWFVGAGLRVVDEDVKSILGLGSRVSR